MSERLKGKRGGNRKFRKRGLEEGMGGNYLPVLGPAAGPCERPDQALLLCHGKHSQMSGRLFGRKKMEKWRDY